MYRLFTMIGGLTLLLSLLVTQHSALVSGQEPKKDPDPKKEKEPEPKKLKETVAIRWYGQSFFQIETKLGFKIVIDPHAIPTFGRTSVSADFVLISHTHDDHGMVGVLEPKVKEADIYRGVVEPKPGKQEWKSINEKRGLIRIRTVATYHDTQNGLQRGKNSVWVVEADGLVYCHLGDLGHELTADQVKAIGKVDVLMVPIGGIYTLNGEQAAAVVKQLKPRLYVLPMHYGVPGYDELAGPEEFLGEHKKEQIKKMPGTNELEFRADMTADAPTVVMLGWKKAEEPKKPDESKKP
jgi:L-ascorbate metabolism protein UlaG (beta-lactamase superfamily)